MRFNGWSIGLINTLKALAATSRARSVRRLLAEPALFLMLALVWPLFAEAAPPIPSEPDASNVSFR
jgi:hypothetical protein